MAAHAAGRARSIRCRSPPWPAPSPALHDPSRPSRPFPFRAIAIIPDHHAKAPEVPAKPVPARVIAAPLFIISNPRLVIEQCKAGVVGAMPALNARPASQLDEWLAEITETLAAHDRAHPDRPAAPFAVNQIVHRSNDRLDHDMAVVREAQGADRHQLARRAHRRQPGDTPPTTAWSCTACSASASAPQGDRQGGRRAVVGRGRCRRPRRREEPVARLQEIRDWPDGPLALSGTSDARA